MVIRNQNGNPGTPLRWRGHVPLAEAPGGEGAGAGGAGAAKDAATGKDDGGLDKKLEAMFAGWATGFEKKFGEALDAKLSKLVAPEPEKKVKAEEKAPVKVPPELQDAFNQLKADFDAKLSTKGAELDKHAKMYGDKLDDDKRAARRAFIRSMPGFASKVSDANLDKLLPDVDPRTQEGERALGEWRRSNSEFFSAPVDPPAADAAKLAGEIGIKGSHIFGPDDAQRVLVQLHGVN